MKIKIYYLLILLIAIYLLKDIDLVIPKNTEILNIKSDTLKGVYVINKNHLSSTTILAFIDPPYDLKNFSTSTMDKTTSHRNLRL